MVPMTVQAPVKAGTAVISTDKTDYFIGEVVQANFSVEWTGGLPPSPTTFEWYTPADVSIFKETLDAFSYEIGNKNYLGALSNWPSNMTGTGFRVKGIHNYSTEFDEFYFNVSHYSDAVYVDNLTLTLNSNFYENGTTAKATANLTFLGNGSYLDNVSFVWNYPNGSEAFNEMKTPISVDTNGSVEVCSYWTIDFEGINFEVVASYLGVAPMSDTAYFDVIPQRVRTWKNQTVSNNEVWNLTDSPFGVCNNITIDLLDSLTIPAGSTVRFCPDTGIFVRGTLRMEGFSTSNITLTSYSYPAGRGDWKGVFFEDSGSDGSVLNNVKVNFSQQGIMLNRASPNLANITIANSSSTGIDAFQTTIFLSGIVIIDSVQGIYSMESTLDLSDSEILRCDDGVVVDQSDGTFERSQIYAISGRGIWARSSSLTIRDSVISVVDTGLILEGSRDFLVEGVTIDADVYALWTLSSTNLTFSQDAFSSGVLSFTATDDTLVVNSTITSSPENFRVRGGSTVTALNCSFDDAPVVVTSGSWLFVQNFLDVHVFDTDGQPLSGASVELILDSTPILPVYTDSGGWVRWQVLLYETFTGPGNPTYTSNQVNVTLDGYNITNNFRTLDMSISRIENFE
ncbi:MAG: right-handed parallel beta-helix repeat-containing protein [Methanobacteriota archaeon]|nr:MAG: right-handed parallel beta-helix repeat-containing protein [Euryarchaeota archaeon]